MVGKSLVGETIRLLLSALAPSTQATYLRFWKFGSRYCESRQISPLVNATEKDWDIDILNFLTWEYSVVKIGGSGLTTRFGAIQFLHSMEGKAEFDHKTHRIHSLIAAVMGKGDTKQQLPVNPDLLRWGADRMSSYEGAMWKAREVWAAILVGFHFALRISEIEGLEDRDISFQDDGKHKSVTIMIRGSKTDQKRLGVRRTLTATNCDLCPFHTMARWLDLKGWRPNYGESLFSRNIATRINHTSKELASENGSGAKRFSTHSLRAGCATTLYAAGVDPIDIQRWGRWKSAIYMRYIWRDNLSLHHLSQALTANTRFGGPFWS